MKKQELKRLNQAKEAKKFIKSLSDSQLFQLRSCFHEQAGVCRDFSHFDYKYHLHAEMTKRGLI